MVFALNRQINKQKYAKTFNFPCAGNKDFVKYQAQGGVNPKPPLVYALGCSFICSLGIRTETTLCCK